MDKIQLTVWVVLLMAGVFVLYRPWYTFSETKYISGKTLRENNSIKKAVYYWTHSLLIVIAAAYIMIFTKFNSKEMAIPIMLTILPTLAFKNAVIGYVFSIYPIERLRESTVFVIDSRSSTIAKQQIMLSIVIFVLPVLYFET